MTEQPSSHWKPSRIESDRLEKLKTLKEQNVEAYPARVERTHTAAQAISVYTEHRNNGGTDETAPTVTVCGRIRRMNIKGKIAFMHIEDQSGRVQLFVRVNDIQEADYALLKDKLIDMDDFVQARGQMMATQAGEISVRVVSLTLLAKSLSPSRSSKNKP
ncbi:MAG UNVERIFIED_CONTAM: OB-fold nucleic acid binding domain-containing protein [Anaerolineae bacterium]|jgi:lysyl-tRNA synthetase class 2